MAFDAIAAKEKISSSSSAYENGMILLKDSYKKGKIFTALPNSSMPLANLEILSVLALSPSARKEIISKYLLTDKVFDISTVGSLAWVLMNVMDEYSDSEKVALEKYFTKYEEYFDKKIDSDGLLAVPEGQDWRKKPDRGGVLIENQAFYAKIIDVLAVLTNDDMYPFKKKRLIRTIREKLNGAYVLDREDSLEVTPNAFLAAFFAPEMFDKDDWQKSFDSSLKSSELWLHWGGLTTLGQTDPKYGPQNDGDSWFFINNIAAIVLQRLEPEKYKPYIEKILSASEKNVLWQEHSGRACEVTLTANRQIKVQGLYGLSLATFIYLYRLLNP